jgi:hypothetical protein
MGQAGVTIGTRIDRLPITSGHDLAPAARGVPEPCTADPRSLLRPPYARRTVMMALFPHELPGTPLETVHTGREVADRGRDRAGPLSGAPTLVGGPAHDS